jgi:hypothetical protein
MLMGRELGTKRDEKVPYHDFSFTERKDHHDSEKET